MPATNGNLPILNTIQYDAEVNKAFNESRKVFEGMTTPYPIPEGSESRTWNFHGEGQEARRIQGIFEDTDYQDLSFSKRLFERKEFDVAAFYIDRNRAKNINFIEDPYYVRETNRALIKQCNREFLLNYDATVAVTDTINASGITSTTNVGFDSSNIISVDRGTNTSEGLTIAKLNTLIGMAEDNNLTGDDIEGEHNYLYMVIKEKYANQLYADARSSSSDYSHFFYYNEERKRIESFRNIKFIYMSNYDQIVGTVTDNSSTALPLYAWHPSAFIEHPPEVKTKGTEEIPTKKYHSQLYAYMTHSIMRVREQAAFKVNVLAL